MALYTKRPPVVEAEQVDKLTLVRSPDEHSTWAHPGDYVVIEENGRQYAVNKVVFEAYYVSVNDNPADIVARAHEQPPAAEAAKPPEFTEFSVGRKAKK